MQPKFRILIAPCQTNGKAEYCWQAVSAVQAIATGFEENVLEAIESAACALGFYLDVNPDLRPAGIVVDVEYDQCTGWRETLAVGGKP